MTYGRQSRPSTLPPSTSSLMPPHRRHTKCGRPNFASVYESRSYFVLLHHRRTALLPRAVVCPAGYRGLALAEDALIDLFADRLSNGLVVRHYGGIEFEPAVGRCKMTVAVRDDGRIEDFGILGAIGGSVGHEPTGASVPVLAAQIRHRRSMPSVAAPAACKVPSRTRRRRRHPTAADGLDLQVCCCTQRPSHLFRWVRRPEAPLGRVGHALAVGLDRGGCGT